MQINWRTDEPEQGREILAVFDVSRIGGVFYCSTTPMIYILHGKKYRLLGGASPVHNFTCSDLFEYKLKKYFYLSDLEEGK